MSATHDADAELRREVRDFILEAALAGRSSQSIGLELVSRWGMRGAEIAEDFGKELQGGLQSS